ncbi:O-antigen polysaccharide polymerase Wzy [Kineosporia mesophila]|uniref:O-antigen polysaccharide polymerase Wzy n=1 Tax=Kineosporia mesophila TaxID=566012 RepID=UPI001E3B9DAF|nr:O-antigen polysaccharide polymerase Wzy [Kineosporia mesophila]
MLAPAAITSWTDSSTGPWKWFLALSVLAALRYSVLVAVGAPRLYELTFWLFVYLFLGLAPMVQIRMNAYPETTPGMLTQIGGRSAAVIVIGVLAFMVGALVSRPSGETGASRVRIVDANAAMKLSFFSLVYTLWYIHAVGPALFSDRSTYSVARSLLWPNPAVGSIVSALATTPLLVSTAALLIVYKREPKGSLKLLIAAQIVTLMLVVNPVSGARIAFGSVLLSLIAMLGGFGTSKRFRISAITVLIGMSLIFPYADYFRHGAEGQSAFGKGNPIEAMTKGDFDGYAQVTNSVNYVDNHGVTYGNQALGVVLFWVPRSIWPEKADDTGVVLAADRGYGFKNLSAPLWSELYINGKWAALALGMALLGWVLKRQDNLRVRLPEVGVAGTILPFTMLIILRGSLLQAIASFAAVILFSLFVTRSVLDVQPGARDQSQQLPSPR